MHPVQIEFTLNFCIIQCVIVILKMLAMFWNPSGERVNFMSKPGQVNNQMVFLLLFLTCDNGSLAWRVLL